MNELVITNDHQRKAAAYRLMNETKQNERQFIEQWGGVLCHDLIDWTPPRGKNPNKESWAEQKGRGEQKEASDIRKVFRSRSDLLAVLSLHPLVQQRPKLLDTLTALVNRGDVDTLQRVLLKMRSKIVLLSQPTKELHFGERGPRGTVRKPKNRFYFLNDGPVNGYVEMMRKDIGKAKAGWLTDQLKVKDVPQWVRRHKGADGARVDLKGPRYSVHLRNTAPTTKGMRANDMVDPAVEILGKKMMVSLKAITRGH